MMAYMSTIFMAPVFLILALNGGEQLTLGPGHFGLGKNPYTHSVGCWVGFILEKKKSLAASEFKTWLSHSTNYTSL